MPIAIKTKTVKPATTTKAPETGNRATATLERIPGQGMVAHVIIPVDMNKLRYKGGKSAYFPFGVWIDGQKGCRVQGNVFVSIRRLTKETLDKARHNYENKSQATNIDEDADEEELF